MPSTVVVEERPVKARPEFRFDPESHTYWLGSVRLPGTTEILKSCGVIDTTYYTEAGRRRGEAVHRACHYLGEGDLNWDTVTLPILGFVRAYEKFMIKENFHPRIMEVPIHNPINLYGTIPDARGPIWRDPDDAVVEIKSRKIPKWARLQTAAQAMAIDPANWRRIPRIAVELHEDGSYLVDQYNDPNDGYLFLSMVAVTNYKNNLKGGNHVHNGVGNASIGSRSI